MLPLRMSIDGTLSTMGVWRGRRRPSKLMKKKVLSWPLNRCGIWTGPPSVPPKSFMMIFGLEIAKMLLELRIVFS